MSDEPKDQKSEQTQYSGQESRGGGGGSELENILKNILAQLQIGGFPIKFVTTALSPEEMDLRGKINDRLVGKNQIPGGGRRGEVCIIPISVAFPECSDVLLSLINTKNPIVPDEITEYFNDYFMFCDHYTIIERADAQLKDALDPKLLECTGKWFQHINPTSCQEVIIEVQGPRIQQSAGTTGEHPDPGPAKPTDPRPTPPDPTCPDPYRQTWPPKWPPFWCLPPSCITLSGKRHLYLVPTFGTALSDRIKRLFIADLVWLFYFERMGIFKILGVILDDFATKGRIPISNGIVNPPGIGPIKDDIIAIVLESMVRKTESGLSSRISSRTSSYRRCLNWTSDVGRKLGLDTAVNMGFNNLFHKFIQNALEFYKDKRLATAIQGVTVPTAKTSMSTLITISDTLDLLKKAFDPFDYGRNYSNTLSGIVWVIAGMALIREIRTTLGIPPEYDKPYEYIPAAYDLLVMKRPITPSETNRYTVHRECANDARDILLDLEVINHQDTTIGGELELWLSIIEQKVEGYRTAYRALTGVDLGAPGTPVIEQQV